MGNGFRRITKIKDDASLQVLYFLPNSTYIDLYVDLEVAGTSRSHLEVGTSSGRPNVENVDYIEDDDVGGPIMEDGDHMEDNHAEDDEGYTLISDQSDENQSISEGSRESDEEIVMYPAAAELRCVLQGGLVDCRRRSRFGGGASPEKYGPKFVAMAQKKKVNKYDSNWKKEWFGAGLFYEGSEEVEFDVIKKLEKRKVLSNVEKAGLLSKAEELGFTLSSIEKLGLLSKAEELGLLSLLEKVAGSSPSTLASAALPILVAAIVAIVVIPDDSVGLVAVQAVVGGALAVGAAGLFVGSVVLDGLQEAD
ncbi:OLC1v1012709C1 [Oldenlandia corymbosa var. corymbosa]|uniref:OLC1v1012709C1 n=1 Tax=Oldenlandia corymbosa var. corymbosa TaxID=529605 RepID=A0AAV1DWT9_OLDCO|nr:OLC1v1012709C1 [Oldenlandia corymbosa var. corymbosa]